ncbi:MAG: CRISPR-associated protein Csx15 [Anaerolineae bacterium]
MILLNFSHPITDPQRGQIEALLGQSIGREIAAMPQFDEQQPFGPQMDALLGRIDLSPAQWQGEPILVVLPSLNFIAAALLAELHGRMGYFPPVVRTRPVAGALPRQFEVAEILDLQGVREAARGRRRERER